MHAIETILIGAAVLTAFIVVAVLGIELGIAIGEKRRRGSGMIDLTGTRQRRKEE